MNIIQLTYFKHVVDEMSVTKAARRLFVTQSAVSQQITLLAENLGCQLFYRRGRCLQITPDGEFLYQKAKNIISQFDGLRDELKSRDKKVFGTVKIGSGPVTSKEFLPDIVSNMLKHYPDVSFSIFEIHSNQLMQAIIDSQIDLGIGLINDKDERLHYEKLMTGRMVLICSSQSNWSSRRSVSLQELSEIDLIRRVKEVENESLNNLLKGENCIRKFHLAAMNTETIVPYVKRGMGMALVPNYVIKWMNPEGISIIELEEKIELSWGVIRDKFRPVSKAAQLFIDNLKEKLQH